MSDLQTLVAEVTQEIEDSGFMRQALKNAMEKSIVSAAENLFKSYGSFGKALEAKMESELVLNLNKLSVASYGDVLLTQMRGVMDETVMAAASGKVQKLIEKYLTKLEKMNWKLSEIIHIWKTEVYQYRMGDGDQIGFVCEESEYSKGCYFIGFDEEPMEAGYGTKSRKRSYQMKFQLTVRPDGTLADFSVDGKTPQKLASLVKVDVYGFAAFLLALYANQAVIEVDEDEVILDWNERD